MTVTPPFDVIVVLRDMMESLDIWRMNQSAASILQASQQKEEIANPNAVPDPVAIMCPSVVQMIQP